VSRLGVSPCLSDKAAIKGPAGCKNWAENARHGHELAWGHAGPLLARLIDSRLLEVSRIFFSAGKLIGLWRDGMTSRGMIDEQVGTCGTSCTNGLSSTGFVVINSTFKLAGQQRCKNGR
jgi:hypothetical protein